jgi:hypothetical protein
MAGLREKLFFAFFSASCLIEITSDFEQTERLVQKVQREQQELLSVNQKFQPKVDQPLAGISPIGGR